ncbi:fluoride efflux transporter FluC [Leucobacter aridicollis]|uniref:fluoride efflux transporter FluC n=1 Tax=Leucobacter aridicollis TaxID=283878 RepID=UPI000E64684D|nr:CrcB family protein [Leucobacter aridicollis]UTX54474.1 CrcB family protein [Leucobacter aridicollis]
MSAVPGPRDVALVGIGGALGSVTRYLTGYALPWDANVSTFAINVVGSLLLGLMVAGFAGRRPRLQLTLGTGFCGGFTTYSALAVGIAELTRSGEVFSAMLLALGTVACTGVASLVGVLIGRRLSAASAA